MKGKRIKVALIGTLACGILGVGLGSTIISSKASEPEVVSNIEETTFNPEGVIIEGCQKRSDLITKALSYVGNKYVYGGESLTDGIDNSGFTKAIFQMFGIDLPRTASAQSKMGDKVENINSAKPGDLIFYGTGGVVRHVAIYIGNGQIVHASNSADYPKGGIKIEDAEYANIYCIKTFPELDK